MYNKPGYCPLCHAELPLQAVEAHTQNRCWGPCLTPRCNNREDLKSDSEGWILEPQKWRGRYVYSHYSVRD